MYLFLLNLNIANYYYNFVKLWRKIISINVVLKIQFFRAAWHTICKKVELVRVHKFTFTLAKVSLRCKIQGWENSKGK